MAGSDDLVVVGEAGSTTRAIELARTLLPTIVTVGNSAELDAFSLTASIMSSAAVPVIIISPPQHAREGAIRAVKVGAVAFVEMPETDGSAQRKAVAEVTYLIRTMAEVKVVTRHSRGQKPKTGSNAKITELPRALRADTDIDVIAIGASTGGPQALHAVLSKLPALLPVPVLIVQHLSSGFENALVDYFRDAGPLAVRMAEDGEPMSRGVVYIAPDNHHMGVDRAGRIVLSDAPPENGLRPAVGFLFRSVRNAFQERALGVLLTGMGRDGAEELARLREAGAVTIAQDEATSVVFGMPREAIALGGAKYILGIDEIAPAITELTRNREKRHSRAWL